MYTPVATRVKREHPHPVRRIPWIPLLVLLGMGLIAWRVAPDVGNLAALVRDVDPAWLVLAAVLQLATYLGVAIVYRTLASALGVRLPLARGCRMAVVNLFVNAALPTAGLSGNLFLVRMMDRSGVPPGTGGLVVLGERIAYFIALVALVTVFAGREISRLGGAGGVAAVPVLLLVVLGFALGIRLLLKSPVRVAEAAGRGIARLPRRVRARMIAPERLVEDARRVEASGGVAAITPARMAIAILMEGGVLACDALTVWAVLRGLGVETGPLQPAIAFGVSTLFAQLVLIPGTLEVSLGGVLMAQHVRPAAALAATAIFHAFSLWAPLPFGAWFYGRAEGTTRRPSASTSSTSRGPRSVSGAGPSS